MKKYILQLMMLSFASATVLANSSCNDTLQKAPVRQADAANAGLTLPQGFGAVVVADNLGHTRHLVVTPQGEIYTKLVFGKRDKYKSAVLHLVDLNGDG